MDLRPSRPILRREVPLAFTVTGNSTPQTITFSDVRSVITSDPFNVKLVFGSKERNSGTYTNTIESLAATLVTSTTTVPEPASMLLVGNGLVALGAWRIQQAAPFVLLAPDC